MKKVVRGETYDDSDLESILLYDEGLIVSGNEREGP